MSRLTDTEAFREASTLRAEFNQHQLMRDRRAVVGRSLSMDAMLEAIGISSATLKNVVPWQSEAPNQEAHNYATALSLADPEVQVFVQSEQPSKHKIGEKWERFYNGVVGHIMPNDYELCRHMAVDGFGVRRLDERGAYFSGVPERVKDEDADPYNERVEEYRTGFGLPFSLITVDPETFYYIENRERTEVIFGCEWAQARESEVKDDGDFTKLGELLVVRTPEMCWNWWVADSGQSATEGELVYEGENRFGHTGYVLYRGRYTGLPEIEKRYDPFMLSTLNAAQHLSLFMTLQANFAVQAGTHWLEQDLPKMQGPTARAVTVERKTKSRGAQQRTERGSAAAEFAPGVHVRFRDLAGDYAAMVAQLQGEYDMYRFKDVLMGEASADASGRAIIRLQEAAGRQLAPGYRARKLATEEILRIIRKTLCTRKEYLGGETVKRVYIRSLVEAMEADADMGREDIISIEASDNIPHEINVKVEAMTQAAQLAWIEQGMALEGTFSRDTIDEDFYKIKDSQRENRRRVKDQLRARVYPTAMDIGAKDALNEIMKTRPIPPGLVMPPAGETEMGGNGAQPTLARSGQPDAVQTEDAGTMMGGGGGVMPGPE